MSIWDDIEDVASSVVDQLKRGVDTIAQILHGLPGATWIEDAAKQGATWAHGLASTPVGQRLLQVLAATVHSNLAWYVGPALGNVLWSLNEHMPVLLPEGPFTENWVSRFAQRSEAVAGVLGTSDMSELLTSPLQRSVDGVIERARNKYPQQPIREAVKHLDISQLAKDFGVREDVIVLAIDLVSQSSSDLSRYDLRTGHGPPVKLLGKRGASPSKGTPLPTSSSALYAMWKEAVRTKRPPAVITALDSQWRIALAREKAQSGDQVKRIPGLGFSPMRAVQSISSTQRPSVRSPYALPEKYRVGGFFDPFVDVATSVIDKTKAIASPIVKTLKGLPGANLIEDAVNQGAKWVGDLASTQTGTDVLRALATFAYGPIAYSLGGIAWFGPQLATVVWAVPGVARGEDFTTAWTKEFVWRVEKTAEAIGTDAAKQLFEVLPGIIQRLVEKAKSQFPGLDLGQALEELHITPEALADEMGIRPDVAALALEYVKGRTDIYDLSDYDIRTGRLALKLPVKTLGKKGDTRTPAQRAEALKTWRAADALKTTKDRYNDWQKAVKDKRPAAVIAALRIQYMNAAAADQARQKQLGMVMQPIKRSPALTSMTSMAQPVSRHELPISAPAPKTTAPSPSRPSSEMYMLAAPSGADPVLFSAKATLVQAIQELGGVTPTEQALYWMLGLVYGESRFGTSPDWTMPNENNPNPPFEGPSHNWGAVRYFKGDNLIVRHPDLGGVFNFQAYKTALEGAKGFFRTIVRGKVKEVLSSPSATPRDLAEAMYINGYYEGYNCSNEGQPTIRLNGKGPVGCKAGTKTQRIYPTQAEADQKNITEYASMIFNESEKIRKIFSAGPGPTPAPPPVPKPPEPVPGPAKSSTFPYLLAGSILAVGAAGTYMLTRKRGGILSRIRVW